MTGARYLKEIKVPIGRRRRFEVATALLIPMYFNGRCVARNIASRQINLIEPRIVVATRRRLLQPKVVDSHLKGQFQFIILTQYDIIFARYDGIIRSTYNVSFMLRSTLRNMAISVHLRITHNG